MKFSREIIKNFSLISQLGISMVVPILMCLFLGIWLDKTFGTEPLFLIIFIILGVLSSFRNMYVLTMSTIEKDKKKRGK